MGGREDFVNEIVCIKSGAGSGSFLPVIPGMFIFRNCSRSIEWSLLRNVQFLCGSSGSFLALNIMEVFVILNVCGHFEFSISCCDGIVRCWVPRANCQQLGLVCVRVLLLYLWWESQDVFCVLNIPTRRGQGCLFLFHRGDKCLLESRWVQFVESCPWGERVAPCMDYKSVLRGVMECALASFVNVVCSS